MDAVVRAARWLGRFLWDFIVGDTPELALATGAIVAIAFLLAGTEWLGAILLPLCAAGFPRQHVARPKTGAEPLRAALTLDS